MKSVLMKLDDTELLRLNSSAHFAALSTRYVIVTIVDVQVMT